MSMYIYAPKMNNIMSTEKQMTSFVQMKWRLSGTIVSQLLHFQFLTTCTAGIKSEVVLQIRLIKYM